MSLKCVEDYASEYSAETYDRLGGKPNVAKTGITGNRVILSFKNTRTGVTKYKKVVFEDESIIAHDISIKSGESKQFRCNFPIRPSLPPEHVFEDALVWELDLAVDFKSAKDVHVSKPVRIITYISKVPRQEMQS